MESLFLPLSSIAVCRRIDDFLGFPWPLEGTCLAGTCLAHWSWDCFQEAVRQIGMMLTTSHNHIEDLHTVEHGKESLFPSIASFQMNDSSEGKTDGISSITI